MRKQPCPTELEQELSGYFSLAMKTPLPDLIKRDEKLRVSGFPFCGLQKAYMKMDKATDPEKQLPEKADAGREFYTSVGTAAHLVFQRWLGQKGQMWGNWKCYNKSCNHFIEFGKKRKCPKCKSEMEYEEFEVKAFRHLSGHIDGVFQDAEGRFWVIDYKTTSCRAIDAQKEWPTFPYAKNKAQIMTYCALIEQKYDIKIEGWALLYVARDDPFRVQVCAGVVNAKQKAKIIAKCKLYDDQYEVMQGKMQKSDPEFLIETKPCKSYEFYTEHFKGMTGCPLEAVCFQPKRLLETVKMTYIDYKKLQSLTGSLVDKVSKAKLLK